MATGDIIFEDGTVVTPADLERLLPLIEEKLGSTAKDPSQYPSFERLDGLTSIPCFDASYNLGRVSIALLRGVNGKNVELRMSGDMLQWSLEGTDIWYDLFSKADLKGDPGAAANMEIGEVTSGDTPAATISGEAPNYKLNLVLVPGGKGDTGDNGKTPVLASVSAKSGETASGNFTEDGFDESGNPKYILDLTLPKGQDGQPAIFEQGTTTTLNPSEEARVEVVENGLTPEGNPKYLLNFFIPRGPAGPAGTGTGNVLVDATGLVIGKRYLFVPDADDSTAGSFVEYVTPEIPEQVQPDWDATEGKGAILNKPGNATADSSGLMSADQFQKLEKLNPSYLSNAVTGKKVEYTDAGKLLFEGKEAFAVDADNELTLAGKKLSELGGSGAVPIPYEIISLNNESTSDEIKAALGGDEGFELIYEGAKNGVCYIDMSAASDGLLVGGIICQAYLSGLDSGVQMINIAADLSVFGGDPGTYSISKNGDAYAIDVQISEKKEYLSLPLNDEGLKGFWVRSGRIDVVNLYDLFQRKITITTNAPASNNGIDGDIWIQYKE